ncbi:MAG: prepilin peptidase [Lachnospiraceae bacterium]|nr:prepilin peptidase [Lachnospiraceae bacterium]
MNLWADKIRIFLCFVILLWEGLLDRKNRKIFLPPVFFFFAAGMVLSMIQGRRDFMHALFGAMTGGVVLLIAFVTKNKIGCGDGLLLIATGALLGLKVNLFMFLFGLFLASLKGIWLLLSGKGNKNTDMPFIPFLIPGLTLTLAVITGG